MSLSNFVRAARLVSLICCNLAAIYAQNQDQTIQSLLANDDALAALHQQFASKQIGNLEHTQKAQELGKARKQILSGYNRGEQKELLGRYNAIVKERRAAALDVKRRADADAKAQAAAAAEEKKAATQQAANDAAAEVSKAIEDDAQEYLRIATRHDGLVQRLTTHQITPEEKQEMATLSARSAGIERKYANGGPSQPDSARFEARLAELRAQKGAPVKQIAISSGFPDASAVVAGYSDDGRRLAALRLLEKMILDQGARATPAATSKIQSYHAMMQKLDPDNAGPQHLAIQNTVNELLRSNQFQFEVLHKFAPGYEAAPLRELKTAAFQERQRRENQRFNLAIMATVLVILALPILYLMAGERSFRNGSRHPDPNYPFQVPKSLLMVTVLSKVFDLDYDCGLIRQVESWKETRRYNYQATSAHDPGSVINPASARSSTLYHKYTFRTPDGRTIWRTFTNNAFPASKGHLIGTVDHGSDIVLACNYSTGQFLEVSGGLATAVSMKGRWIWLATVAAAVLCTVLLFVYLFPGTLQEKDPRTIHISWALPLFLGFCSAVYIMILKFVIAGMRRSQFRARWVPKFRDFMLQRRPFVEERYPGDEQERAARGLA